MGFAFFFVLCLRFVGLVQTFRGGIKDTVSDPSGAVVASADVKATNVATAITITATTTSDGAFSFQDLPLGTYKISVTAPGFKSVTIDNITVTAGSSYTLPVKLAPGSARTTVGEVSYPSRKTRPPAPPVQPVGGFPPPPPPLNPPTAPKNNLFPAEAVRDVPMKGRDFPQFAAVQPGYGGSPVGGYGSLKGPRPNQMN